ncbi:UDP-N-acetylmuramoyl-L-alanine--D-glutamate ligase [Vibrio sp. SM6]|uniref:UDP-N-acetylmuramoylalanine--D-glutamate ligase n=1 Tax=Vibrio agarilyticus TaxID=2726741 RepID=A0A7X8TQC6_9VIBR|nr:UDP-N-acetylmuramoyl-L-alanine--D-glutamate ligase [Vibrio agarilyticus]NLS12298.1 UDP-N-acetylmuramoyl-L-alanine--D-glutamate ligase [Vibrio agarilyticus]
MSVGLANWNGVKQVVVVGLGMTGLSVVNYLKKHQPQVTIRVIDTRETPPGLCDLPSDIAVHYGSWQQEWLMAADLIVANPGIALASPPIQAAIEHGVRVVGDIELFAWAVNKPVVAITGSNGKSTVTDLTGVLLSASGLNVGVGGNIGVAALDLLALDADVYVLELSSFQLETTSSLCLVAAAFLNLTEDHMDRYQGMDDYRAAKLRIFAHAQRAIVNRDDAQTWPESKTSLRSFGFDQKEFGTLVHQNERWLSVDGKPLIPTRQLQLVGQHNVANALVALALVESLGRPLEPILGALAEYRGLSHRCQVVLERGGVKWVNDSKATNVASTLAALSGLEGVNTLYLLVGGVGKGADFSELAPVLATLNVNLLCFGADGDQFVPLHSSARLFDTMEQAIAAASASLDYGDMVMLSPACASFDQFANFMARGEAFAELAKQYG